MCCNGVCGPGAPPTGVCRPVFGIGGYCQPGERSAYPCLTGLDCMPVPALFTDGGPPASETFCTKPCSVEVPVGSLFPERVTPDCSGGLLPYQQYWCATTPPELGPGNGICRVRGRTFSRCYNSAQEMCEPENFCWSAAADQPGLCLADLKDGDPCLCPIAACAESVMCRSGCCAFDPADARNECVTRSPCI